MLYLPWTNVGIDLLGGYFDFHSHYEDKLDVILANEWKYSHNATLIPYGHYRLHVLNLAKLVNLKSGQPAIPYCLFLSGPG